MTTNGGKGKPPTKARQPKMSRKSTKICASQKTGKGRKWGAGDMLLTGCEDDVEDFLVGQFGRDGIAGGGGGSRGPGIFLGDDWDRHRGERDDDDQQIEASPEESFGESLSEGHSLVVFEIIERG
jgi:hypothetical protein